MALAAYEQHQSSHTQFNSMNTDDMLSRMIMSSRFQSRMLLVQGSTINTKKLAQRFISEAFVGANSAVVDASQMRDNIQLRSQLIEQLIGSSIFDPEKSLLQNLKQGLRGQSRVILQVLNADNLEPRILAELIELVMAAKSLKLSVMLTSVFTIETPQTAPTISFHLQGARYDEDLSVGDNPAQHLQDEKAAKDTRSNYPLLGLLLLLSLAALAYSQWSLMAPQEQTIVGKTEFAAQASSFNEQSEPNTLPAPASSVESVIFDESAADSAVDLNKEPTLAEPISAPIEAKMELPEASVTETTDIIPSVAEPKVESTPASVALESIVTTVETSQSAEEKAQEAPELRESIPETITSSEITEIATLEPPTSDLENATASSPNATIQPSLYGDAEVILELDPTSYTIQLAGLSSQKLLTDFFNDQRLSGKVWVYRTQRNNQDWFVVIKGQYASIAEARNAQATYPERLRKLGGWAKSVDKVQKEITLY